MRSMAWRRRRRRRTWSDQLPRSRPRRFAFRARTDSQRALFALVFLLLLALAAHRLWKERPWATQRPAPSIPSTRPTAPARAIRIATWNLKKFSDRARPDLVTIASLIKSNAFDLLAIQEVQHQGQTVQRLRMTLGEPWRHVISDQ